MLEELKQRIESYANARRSEDLRLQQFATGHLMELLDHIVIFAKNDPKIQHLVQEKTPEAEEEPASGEAEVVKPSQNGRSKVEA